MKSSKIITVAEVILFEGEGEQKGTKTKTNKNKHTYTHKREEVFIHSYSHDTERSGRDCNFPLNSSKMPLNIFLLADSCIRSLKINPNLV